MLFIYNEAQRLAAYIDGSPEKVVIFMGGLGDGMGGLLWMDNGFKIADDWSLVRLDSRNAHAQWSIGTLENDADDLHSLITKLVDRQNTRKIVLIGHSTGCQDIVFLLSERHPETIKHLDGVILHSPVSDAEYIKYSFDPALLQECIKRCQGALEKHAQNNGKTYPGPLIGPLAPFEGLVLPEFYTNIVFSAKRFLSIVIEQGHEDFFSSYLSDEQLESRFKYLREIPLLLLMAEKDQFVPSSVDKKALLSRFEKAASHPNRSSSTPRSAFVLDDDHTVATETAIACFRSLITKFVLNLDEYR